ncbi:MAG: CCA tRNA nucleotidyltransferase [Campylobacterales bacterium]|nr:CCA tRNA nucleotidyltransferase [Campylobacterales bacterium]
MVTHFKYPKKLNKIFQKLILQDAKPIIVGGFVRDAFLDITSLDIDIEVYGVASFEDLEEMLKEFGAVNSVGKSFGVCKLDYGDFKLDFTLPRRDNKVAKGHRGFEIEIDPNLEFKVATSRRDFTINSIGYDVKEGKILDPFGGLYDLKNKTLKIVDEKSFKEDPLRVLRAMQFCARFELSVDATLITVSKQMCKNNLLTELPTQRIEEEFKKLFLKAKKPSNGLEFLKVVDALEFFNELKLDDAKWISTLKNIDKCKNDLFISLAVVCHKMPRCNVESFLNKITNKKNLPKEIKQLYHVIDFFEHKSDILSYSIIKKVDLKNVDIFLKIVEINDINIQKYIPKINGKELIELGFKSSKELSKILQLHYEMQLISLC